MLPPSLRQQALCIRSTIPLHHNNILRTLTPTVRMPPIMPTDSNKRIQRLVMRIMLDTHMQAIRILPQWPHNHSSMHMLLGLLATGLWQREQVITYKRLPQRSLAGIWLCHSPQISCQDLVKPPGCRCQSPTKCLAPSAALSSEMLTVTLDLVSTSSIRRHKMASG